MQIIERFEGAFAVSRVKIFQYCVLQYTKWVLLPTVKVYTNFLENVLGHVVLRYIDENICCSGVIQGSVVGRHFVPSLDTARLLWGSVT